MTTPPIGERGDNLPASVSPFTGREQDVLICVVRHSEATRLRRVIKEIDPQAFLVIAEAQEVIGQGFTTEISPPPAELS